MDEGSDLKIWVFKGLLIKSLKDIFNTFKGVEV